MSLSVQSSPSTDADSNCIFEKQKEYWDAWQKHMQGFDWTKIVEICNYIDHHIIAPAVCMSLLPEATLGQSQGTIKNVGSNFGTNDNDNNNTNNNNNNSKINSNNNVIDDPNDFSFTSKESDEEDALSVLYGFRGDEENFSESEEEIVKKKTTRKGSLSATAVGRASSSNNNGNSNGKKKVKKNVQTEKKPSSKKSMGGSSEDLSDSLGSSSKRRRSL